jgi:hypothetical protein
MNNTVIPQQTLANLKMLVSNIEMVNTLLKNYDNLFELQNFELTEVQLFERKQYKKDKKRYQKQINQIIKNL